MSSPYREPSVPADAEPFGDLARRAEKVRRDPALSTALLHRPSRRGEALALALALIIVVCAVARLWLVLAPRSYGGVPRRDVGFVSFLLLAIIAGWARVAYQRGRRAVADLYAGIAVVVEITNAKGRPVDDTFVGTRFVTLWPEGAPVLRLRCRSRDYLRPGAIGVAHWAGDSMYSFTCFDA